ncbi:MAG: hypothetical protein IJ760_05780 [Bacteroidales bacterium]|nr:hypothetical protein [Bacteroidales bacterium]
MKYLALFAMLLAFIVPGAPGPEAALHDAGLCKSVERPSWEDMGMCDVLAVPCGQSLTPPSTSRLLPGNQAGGSAQAQVLTRLFASARSHGFPPRSHTRGGFIYLLRRLRL